RPAIAFSPDGKLLAREAGGGSVLLYSVATRRQVDRVQTGLKRPNHLVWIPGSRVLLIASFFDSTVQLWDLAGKGHEVLNSEAGNVFALAVSPDAKTLAVSTQDGAIVLWNLPTRRQLTTLRGHLTQVGGL